MAVNDSTLKKATWVYYIESLGKDQFGRNKYKILPWARVEVGDGAEDVFFVPLQLPCFNDPGTEPAAVIFEPAPFRPMPDENSRPKVSGGDNDLLSKPGPIGVHFMGGV